MYQYFILIGMGVIGVIIEGGGQGSHTIDAHGRLHVHIESIRIHNPPNWTAMSSQARLTRF